MAKEMMTPMTGRSMLEYLSTLNEKELAMSFVAVIKLADSEEDYALYPCIGCSVQPNDLLGFHVAPDARIPRIPYMEAPMVTPKGLRPRT